MSHERSTTAQPVLLLGPEPATRRFAGQLLLLGYRGLGAIDAGSAIRVLAGCEIAILAGIVASELPEPAAVIAEIHRALAKPLAWLIWGPRPGSAAAEALRGQNVRFTLSEPFTEEDLRFVLNGAHHHADRANQRIVEPRVPTSLRARIIAKTGERVAMVCNLSTDGAFLSTPRPTLRGGRIEVEIPLPSLTIRTAADVVWNNVPGNLRRANAPIGMGVRFVGLPAPSVAALRAYLEERAASYRL